MGCSPPGSSVRGISQARIVEWVVIPFSRESSPPRDQTWISWVSSIGRWIFYRWAHQGSPSITIYINIYKVHRFSSIRYLLNKVAKVNGSNDNTPPLAQWPEGLKLLSVRQGQSNRPCPERSLKVLNETELRECKCAVSCWGSSKCWQTGGKWG